MTKKISLLFLLFLGFYSIKSQTVIWTEDFQNGCAAACPGVGYAGVNGAWAQTITGAEGADPNTFFVSCAENNTGVGNCSSGCAGNQTLHLSAAIGNLFCPNDCGAAYDAGGLCGLLSCPQTDKRIESPIINLTGQTTITINFVYLEGGQTTQDDATLWYFDGATWTMIDNMPKTLVPAACLGQGEWAARAVALPASANNNANVRIGFRWVNDDDGAGTDPSFAVDDITLTIPTVGGPTASFSSTDSTLCLNDCINFSDLSTGVPTGWTWYFPGSTTPTSSAQNPTNICYNTAGNFDVSLVADDGSTTDSLYLPNFIIVSALPTITANATNTVICSGDIITLTGGGGVSYLWDNGAVDGNPFSPGATTNYTVTGTDANGCVNTDQILITVNSCGAPPVVSFSASDSTICVGDCINFNDLSTGAPTGWIWYFFGAPTINSNSQNPTNFCYTAAGSFDVALVDTNSSGQDSLFMPGFITVSPLPTITANSTNSVVCSGSQITLTGSGGLSYTWSNGVSDGVAFTPSISTTYTVTGTDANGCVNTDQILITVNSCVNPPVPALNNPRVPTAIVIPNVFSPNGDGQNDLFNPTGGFKTLHMEIYNRWGELLFKSDLLNEGWNGRTTAGVKCSEGTYFYIIDTDIETYKGTLTLIR